MVVTVLSSAFIKADKVNIKQKQNIGNCRMEYGYEWQGLRKPSEQGSSLPAGSGSQVTTTSFKWLCFSDPPPAPMTAI